MKLINSLCIMKCQKESKQFLIFLNLVEIFWSNYILLHHVYVNYYLHMAQWFYQIVAKVIWMKCLWTIPNVGAWNHHNLKPSFLPNPSSPSLSLSKFTMDESIAPIVSNVESQAPISLSFLNDLKMLLDYTLNTKDSIDLENLYTEISSRISQFLH